VIRKNLGSVSGIGSEMDPCSRLRLQAVLENRIKVLSSRCVVERKVGPFHFPNDDSGERVAIQGSDLFTTKFDLFQLDQLLNTDLKTFAKSAQANVLKSTFNASSEFVNSHQSKVVVTQVRCLVSMT
jgi:hypothetical protein